MANTQIVGEPTSWDNALTVHAETVQIHCLLPTGITPQASGSYARFRQRHVTANLTEQDILWHFLIGLHTPLEAQTRTSIAPFGSTWLLHLGSMSTEITDEEAADVCACIDIVGQKYLDALQEASSLLDVWSYSQIEVDGSRGVFILAVSAGLWHLMQLFVDDFSKQRGASHWHIFDNGANNVRICRMKPGIHATIHPVFAHPTLPSGSIGLMYVYPDQHLAHAEHRQETPWQEQIGPDSFWTASFTEDWLTQQFIPEVLAHFQRPVITFPRTNKRRLAMLARALSPRSHASQQRIQTPYRSLRREEHLPLASLSDVWQLSLFLEDIRAWLACYPARDLSTDLLAPFYKGLTEIARQMEVPLSDDDFSLWYYVKSAFPENDTAAKDWDMQGREGAQTYAYMLQALDLHVNRVETHPVESVWQAHALTCAFLLIVQNGQAKESSIHLENAVQALTPLWQYARCITRYCRPSSFSNGK